MTLAVCGRALILLERHVTVTSKEWDDVGSNDLLDISLSVDAIAPTLANVLKENRS